MHARVHARLRTQTPPFAFTLTLQHRTLRLRALDAPSWRQWVHAIRCAIDDANTLGGGMDSRGGWDVAAAAAAVGGAAAAADDKKCAVM